MWSPDGKHIAYAWSRGGPLGLYVTSADGTGSPEFLYTPRANLYITDWSRDGRFLTFYDLENLYVLPFVADSAAERRPVIVSRQAVAGRFSPDGRFLAYASSQSGPWEIWVRQLDVSGDGRISVSRDALRITEQGGICTCGWSPDGRELYYQALDGSMMATEIHATPALRADKPRLLFKGPSVRFPVSNTSISRDGKQFLFLF